MPAAPEVKFYPKWEEMVNIFSHATGLVLSLVALVFLIVRAVELDDVWRLVSFSIFGSSLVIVYLASTLYHSAKEPERRSRLRIADHAAIYVLIAGTYTPFTLVTLSGTVGWVIFGVTWGMALIGIVLKFFFTGKYTLLSTLMYVFMGWLIVFAIGPLIDNLSSAGLDWLIAGGVAYTVGAILYGFKLVSFNHAIFHLFVLLGSACHFMSVYFHV